MKADAKLPPDVQMVLLMASRFELKKDWLDELKVWMMGQRKEPMR